MSLGRLAAPRTQVKRGWRHTLVMPTLGCAEPAGHRGLAVRENGCSGPQPGSTQPNTWFLYVLLLRIFNWHYR